MSNNTPPDHELDEQNGSLWVRFESGGADHEFRFTLVDGAPEEGIDPQAWPEELIQGGESYRIGTRDVPEWIETILAEKGYPLREG